MMKKVLFIAYLYPPIFNSGTRRSLEFVNHLPDTGWSPIVLTVADPSPKHCDPTLMAEVRPGTRIERVPFWSDLASVKVAARLSAVFDPKLMAERLAWRLKSYWAVPDDCGLWLPLAVKRAVQIYRDEGYDAIYATGWPWTSFLIANRISRKTGCPFVIDYRDLWKPAGVEWDRPTLLQRFINPWLEKRVIRNAAAIITVTESFGRILVEDTRQPISPICITNGFDPADFPLATPINNRRDDLTTVVYTGVWRPGYGPADLYLAIKLLLDVDPDALQRLRFVLAGFPPGPAKEHGIDPYVQELGRIPHANAIELMCTSTVVYLPVSAGLYEQASLPGKLFEYLGSGRPILASAAAGSEVERTLAAMGGARCVAPGDIAALSGMLRLLGRGDAGTVFSTRVEDAVRKFTRSSLTRKLAIVLDSAMQRARP